MMVRASESVTWVGRKEGCWIGLKRLPIGYTFRIGLLLELLWELSVGTIADIAVIVFS
jgi:hypothetical protein